MKKILLGVFSAMAICAQADYSYFDVNVTVHAYFDSSVPNIEDYQSAYILYAPLFDYWVHNDKTLDGLKEAAWWSKDHPWIDKGWVNELYYVKDSDRLAVPNEYWSTLATVDKSNDEWGIGWFVAVVTDDDKYTSFAGNWYYNSAENDQNCHYFLDVNNFGDLIKSGDIHPFAAPEPTSSLLLLFGLAGLALKRKRF